MTTSLSALGVFLALSGHAAPAEPLPPWAVARFGDFRGRAGHNHHHRAAILPAHNLLATAGFDSSVEIFDLVSGRRLRSLTIDDSAAGPLCFSPDGKLLAVESRADICLFDLATGKEKVRLKGHSTRIDSLCFSPDGKLLASVEGNEGIRIWQVETGKQLSDLPSGDYKSFACFTPDGKWLAVLADTEKHDQVRFLDPLSGQEDPPLETGMKVGSLVFAPDGKSLATAGDQLRVWDLQTRKLNIAVAYPNPGLHQRRLCKAAFSPDGKLLATASAQTIQLIKTTTGRVVRHIEARPMPAETNSDGSNFISMLAFSPAGDRLYSWCRNDRLRVWDPKTGAETFHPPGHDGAVLSLALSSRTGLIVSRDSSGQFRLWEMTTGKEVPLSTKVPAELLRNTLATDGRWLMIRKEDDTASLVDGTTGEEKIKFPAWTGDFAPSFDRRSDFAFSVDGRSLAAINCAHRLEGKRGLNVKPQSRIQLWHAEGRNERGASESFKKGMDLVLPESSHVRPLSSASFSADGRLLTVIRSSSNVQLLEPATQRTLNIVHPPQGSAYTHAVLSPDGSLLAAVFDSDTVRIWDTTSFAERNTFQAQLSDSVPGSLPALAFSPDGYTLATGGDHRDVLVWEIATGQVRQRFKGHNGAVTAITFSPDGRHLISGSQDWTALVWRVSGPAGPFPGKAQALDALWLALGDRDAEVAWQAMACLIGDPDEALPWLRKQLAQVSLTGAKRVGQLVRDLDNDSYQEREKVTEELIKRGKEIEEDVKRALASDSAEVRIRAERILEAIKDGAPSVEKLRLVRVLEVLERVGAGGQEKPAGQAREELVRLSKDQAGVWLSAQAKASALRRLDRAGRK